MFCSLPNPSLSFLSLPILLSSIIPFSPPLPNPLIHSIRVGTYIYLFIFQHARIIWPRMFYRSGWLRCVGFICIGLCFMFWAGGGVIGVSCWCWREVVYIILYIIHILLLYLVLLYIILFCSSFLFPHPPSPSPLFPSLIFFCSFLSSSLLIQSIRVGTSITLFIFHQYLIPFR